MKRMILTMVVTAMAFVTIGASRADALPILLGTSANLGDAAQDAQLATFIAAYNVANDPDLAAAGALLARVIQDGPAPPGLPTFGSGVTSITIPAGYEYVTLHWGGQNGYVEYWYVGGLATTFNVPQADGVNALSNYSVYLYVPDGGMTLTLLGCGLAGLGMVRRKFRR